MIRQVIVELAQQQQSPPLQTATTAQQNIEIHIRSFQPEPHAQVNCDCDGALLCTTAHAYAGNSVENGIGGKQQRRAHIQTQSQRWCR